MVGIFKLKCPKNTKYGFSRSDVAKIALANLTTVKALFLRLHFYKSLTVDDPTPGRATQASTAFRADRKNKTKGGRETARSNTQNTDIEH